MGQGLSVQASGDAFRFASRFQHASVAQEQQATAETADALCARFLSEVLGEIDGQVRGRLEANNGAVVLAWQRVEDGARIRKEAGLKGFTEEGVAVAAAEVSTLLPIGELVASLAGVTAAEEKGLPLMRSVAAPGVAAAGVAAENAAPAALPKPQADRRLIHNLFVKIKSRDGLVTQAAIKRFFLVGNDAAAIIAGIDAHLSARGGSWPVSLRDFAHGFSLIRPVDRARAFAVPSHSHDGAAGEPSGAQVVAESAVQRQAAPASTAADISAFVATAAADSAASASAAPLLRAAPAAAGDDENCYLTVTEPPLAASATAAPAFGAAAKTAAPMAFMSLFSASDSAPAQPCFLCGRDDHTSDFCPGASVYEPPAGRPAHNAYLAAAQSAVLRAAGGSLALDTSFAEFIQKMDALLEDDATYLPRIAAAGTELPPPGSDQVLSQTPLQRDVVKLLIDMQLRAEHWRAAGSDANDAEIAAQTLEQRQNYSELTLLQKLKWVRGSLAGQWAYLVGDTYTDAPPDGARTEPSPIDSDGLVLFVADFPTGEARSTRVLLRAVEAASELDQRIIAVLHGGDTYYAGSKQEQATHLFEPLDRLLRRPGAQRIDQPTDSRGVVFRNAMGNHDAYGGREAYKYLMDVFEQKGVYFALQNASVRILGLNTAQKDSSPLHTAFNLNPLPELDDAQLEWLKTQIAAAKEQKQKVVLLSHHQPFSHNDFVGNICGGKTAGQPLVNTALCAQLAPLFNDIDAYLFAHEHNFMLFSEYPPAGSSLPPVAGVEASAAPPCLRRPRLIGHGGCPSSSFRSAADMYAAYAGPDLEKRIESNGGWPVPQLLPFVGESGDWRLPYESMQKEPIGPSTGFAFLQIPKAGPPAMLYYNIDPTDGTAKCIFKEQL